MKHYCINKKMYNNGGFTLIEIIIVISIITILLTIAVPSVLGYIETTREKVCETNRLQLQRLYPGYLLSINEEHKDALWNTFLQEYDQELCPSEGTITYVEGEINCSVHSTNNNHDEEENNEDSSVPFL